MGEIRSRFEDRHIGPAQSQIDFMLRELGHDRLDEFIILEKDTASMNLSPR